MGQKPGHFLQAKSADRDVQCPPGTLISLKHSDLAGAAHGQCGLGAHMALDFKAQHLGSLVNYLTLNKKPARHILQVPMVPNHDLNKVICVALFQYQSVHPECFIIGKGVCQGCISSPCLFNFYAEYIMKHAGMEDT